jgi:hypothetical protein
MLHVDLQQSAEGVRPAQLEYPQWVESGHQIAGGMRLAIARAVSRAEAVENTIKSPKAA